MDFSKYVNRTWNVHAIISMISLSLKCGRKKLTNYKKVPDKKCAKQKKFFTENSQLVLDDNR